MGVLQALCALLELTMEIPMSVNAVTAEVPRLHSRINAALPACRVCLCVRE